ncbi:GNAT family N-acetyltransferase [Paenibacillus sp. TAB 01]|uniref:GNAT family N-acetyltransferase n=1 Tax=Paenibacillus sp. TAB 01 TaxID=3368988 RepID=UPI003751509F
MTSDQAAEGIYLSSDPNLLNETFVYQYLGEHMYWAKRLTFQMFQRSVRNSAVVVGVYKGAEQLGFARVVSDCATFAYLTDVFIVEACRGKGLSKQLMQFIIDHPQLQGLRRFMLVTEDAGGLYARYGFTPLSDAGHWMEIYRD